jgi:hypothetical protein
MIARIPRGTPNAGDAELAATTLRIVVGAINPAPGVATAHLDTPATGFGISNRLFDFLLRMSSSSHAGHLQSNFEASGCQVTTTDHTILYIIPGRMAIMSVATVKRQRVPVAQLHELAANKLLGWIRIGRGAAGRPSFLFASTP